MSRSSDSYSWLPGFLRKFLNLDDDMPDYGRSSYSEPSSYSAPPSRPAVSYTPPSYTPPQAPSYTMPQVQAPSYTPAEPAPQRFSATYTPPQGPAGPPPPAPRVPNGNGNGSVTPGANLPPAAPEGYVQPVGYLLRSYARGALPPQGLEQFTRETRATTTDVWNFYSYWTRFQAEEVFKIGREFLDAVFDLKPGESTPASSQTIRRIKVTTGNGDGEEKKIDRVATTTTIDPPPVPTPAAPPAPPAPTAVFSETVTADDAAIPPGGRDVSGEFAARTAAETSAASADLQAEASDVASIAAGAPTTADDPNAGVLGATAAEVKDAAADAAAEARDAAAEVKETPKVVKDIPKNFGNDKKKK